MHLRAVDRIARRIGQQCDNVSEALCQRHYEAIQYGRVQGDGKSGRLELSTSPKQGNNQD